MRAHLQIPEASARKVGVAAEIAETRKAAKYTDLMTSQFAFEPIAVETTGSAE